MHNYKKRPFVLALAFLSVMAARGQDHFSDTAMLNEARNAAIATYHLQRGISSAIFNGIQHLGYSVSIEGHAYQDTDEWQPGSVVYEGINYAGLRLKYDLVTDQVLVQHPNGFGVAVYSPYVRSFRMQDQEFIYLPDDASRSIMPAGFYRWVAKGKLSFLEKSSKRIDEYEDGLKLKRRFIESDQFFALKDGVYSPVRTKKDLYLLAGDKKRMVIHQLKKQGIRFKKNRREALTITAALYNE